MIYLQDDYVMYIELTMFVSHYTTDMWDNEL